MKEKNCCCLPGLFKFSKKIRKLNEPLIIPEDINTFSADDLEEIDDMIKHEKILIHTSPRHVELRNYIERVPTNNIYPTYEKISIDRAKSINWCFEICKCYNLGPNIFEYAILCYDVCKMREIFNNDIVISLSASCQHLSIKREIVLDIYNKFSDGVEIDSFFRQTSKIVREVRKFSERIRLFSDCILEWESLLTLQQKNICLYFHYISTVNIEILRFSYRERVFVFFILSSLFINEGELDDDFALFFRENLAKFEKKKICSLARKLNILLRKIDIQNCQISLSFNNSSCQFIPSKIDSSFEKNFRIFKVLIGGDFEIPKA